MLSTELETAYINIECPHCKKSYLVATKSLAPGQARFQCTSCQTLFGLNWFGNANEEAKTYVIEKVKHTEKCFKCGSNYEEGLKECPHCSVVFFKEPKAKSQIRTPIKEIEHSWQLVKEKYSNQERHEQFIKLCVNHDELTYAGHQYKAILLVNPHDELASKMQKVIQSLAEGKNAMASQPKQSIWQALGFTRITVFACMLSMLLGISFSSLRPLVALGTSILFFVIVFKFWTSKSEV